MRITKRKCLSKYTLILEEDSMSIIFKVLESNKLLKAQVFPLSRTPSVLKNQRKNALKKFKETESLFYKYEKIVDDDSLQVNSKGDKQC